ncbi:MAG: hypothetical protein AAF443_04860 [Chlamydiota bacterium]
MIVLFSAPPAKTMENLEKTRENSHSLQEIEMKARLISPDTLKTQVVW